MEIPVMRLDEEVPIPSRAHPGDAGLDLSAASDIELEPGSRSAVATGIAVALPDGYAGLVVPRSGLALRDGIGIVNAPGLIDSGYRGEIKVILVNHGQKTVEIRRGQRIAQLVVIRVEEASVVEVSELPESVRGERGFGSSGS